jgi:acetolactate synthase I/II/III large subunit
MSKKVLSKSKKLSSKLEIKSNKNLVKEKFTGSQVLLYNLQKNGIKLILGYTGGAIMPTFDQLPNYPKIRFITSRSEQGAGFIAQGYTRATGQIAPVLVTSGPGATNTITVAADSMMDSVAMLIITGQVATNLIGSDAFQESDIIGMMYTCTKHALMPTSSSQIAKSLGQLLYIANHGRPGPVALDLPKNVQIELTDKLEIPLELDLDGISKPLDIDNFDSKKNSSEFLEKTTNFVESLKKAVELINNAKNPVIILGHGLILSNCQKEILEFVQKSQIPCTMTLHGISSLPGSNFLNLGMLGMHGEIEANRAIENSDLIISLGMRFDDRVTGKLSEFAKQKKVIHVEIDPSEIGKNVAVDVAILADLKLTLRELNKKMNEFPIKWTNFEQDLNNSKVNFEEMEKSFWKKQTLKKLNENNNFTKQILSSRLKQQYEIASNRKLSKHYYKEVFENGYGSNNRLLMSRVIHELSNFTKGMDNVVSDVGQHQMFAAKFYKYEKFNSWFNSGGLGTMGFGLPGAIGVKLARPNEEVWSINGDGGIQMNIQELGTMLQEKININIMILNNEYLGMVKQWQNLFFDDNLVETAMINPDFEKLAQAYGIAYKKVERVEEILPALKWAKKETLATIIEFACDKSEHVYPMVSATMAYSEMILNEKDARQKLGKKGDEAPS